MILYTMMPQEWIYPVDDNVYENQQFASIDGVSMIIEKNENNECRIVRLLSTNPQDFLCEQYTPGSLITLTGLQRT